MDQSSNDDKDVEHLMAAHPDVEFPREQALRDPGHVETRTTDVEAPHQQHLPHGVVACGSGCSLSEENVQRRDDPIESKRQEHERPQGSVPWRAELAPQADTDARHAECDENSRVCVPLDRRAVEAIVIRRNTGAGDEESNTGVVQPAEQHVHPLRVATEEMEEE